MTDLQDVKISADAVPGALRQAAASGEWVKSDQALAEVAAQVIEQLLARVRKQDKDMESLIRSFSPRSPRACGS